MNAASKGADALLETWPEAEGWPAEGVREPATGVTVAPEPSRLPERRPRLRLARPGQLLSVVLGGALLVHLGLAGLHLVEVQRQLAAARQLVSEQEAANQALAQQAARRESLAYVEQMARSEFGLVRPGETVYRVGDGQSGPGGRPETGSSAAPAVPGSASSLGAALGALLSR
ncbi:MAG: septum formation initiator family protein [Bacillota bacterium]|nr:septum formation initiator family protein [Bacillota bacterium]